MTDVIYVSTGELSSKLLKSHIADLDNACRSLSKIGSNPTYESVTGCVSLYSSNVLTEINSIKKQLSSISSQLKGYGSILNTGPEAITAVDAFCKSEITTWFERADYRVDNLFANIKTGAESVIDYWVDDYKSKGWSYKVVQSVKAIGKAAPAIIGCAASWVAAPWAPTTWLSTAYGVNSAVSMWSDLDNIWNENYEEVGKVNLLKDTLVEKGGELSKMLGGSERVGEIVGSCVYGLGEITTTVSNGMRINELKNITTTTSSAKQVGKEIQSTLKTDIDDAFDVRSKVIQSDFSFETVKNAVKEVPNAVKGLWDIAVNSPITEVAKDYKLLSYTIPNVLETVSTIDLLKEVADVTSSLTTKGIELINTITNN